jgi:hypothetical protein
MGQPFRLLVTGSRTWDDTGAIEHSLAVILDRHPEGVLLVHGACPRGLAPLRANCRLPAQRRDDRTWRRWLRRVHPRRQSRQHQCRPTGPSRGHTRLASRPALTDSVSFLACLGATLGATRMNDLVVLRTDVNNGKRQTRGHGLI